MNKQTLKGGELLGHIPYSELPSPVKYLINEVDLSDSSNPERGVKLARRDRKFQIAKLVVLPAIGVVSHFTQLHRIVNTSPGVAALAFALGTAYEAMELPAHNAEVTRATLKITKALLNSNHAKVDSFLAKGATHALIDRKGNVHFVKAPSKLANKPFRPIFGRLRAPLERSEIFKRRTMRSPV